jgi:hypothetical protein
MFAPAEQLRTVKFTGFTISYAQFVVHFSFSHFPLQAVDLENKSSIEMRVNKKDEDSYTCILCYSEPF